MCNTLIAHILLTPLSITYKTQTRSVTEPFPLPIDSAYTRPPLRIPTLGVRTNCSRFTALMTWYKNAIIRFTSTPQIRH